MCRAQGITKMKNIDVFNGDADGICALHQLRLVNPVESVLITGVKRDISLLKNVRAESGDEVTVLDISLDKNRVVLERLLSNNVSIRYFDHHFSGVIPEHQNFEVFIDTSADTCTSLLVNDYLKGECLPWAVTAAFGDNLFDSAIAAAKPLSLSNDQLNQLKTLGTLINYNGYGGSLDDLYFTPDALYKIIKPYANPFHFIKETEAFSVLESGYASDMHHANAISPELENSNYAIVILPDEKWSRRVSGVYANQLAQKNPDRAHAILSIQTDDTYVVSVRAPLSNKNGADEVCRQFETGGGRKAAAGINRLAQNEYDRFILVMNDIFKS